MLEYGDFDNKSFLVFPYIDHQVTLRNIAWDRIVFMHKRPPCPFTALVGGGCRSAELIVLGQSLSNRLISELFVHAHECRHGGLEFQALINPRKKQLQNDMTPEKASPPFVARNQEVTT